MKKIVLLAAVLMAGYTVKAQGFYMDASVGYGFGSPTTNFGVKTYQDFTNPMNNTTENLYGTLGNGINVALTPGYFFNDHIGVELGLQGYFGMKSRIEETTTNDKKIYDFKEARTTQFRVIPSLVVSSGNSKKFSVFAKAGIIMPIVGATYGYNESSEANSTLAGITGGAVTHVKREIETVTKGNFTVGFRGAIGVNYKVNDKIAIFAEVQHTSLTIKPKTRKVESYKSNGVDITKEAYIVKTPSGADFNASAAQIGISTGVPNTTGILPTSNTNTEYVDQVSPTSNVAGNPDFNVDNATQERPNKANFSQLGLNIGVKFNF